MLRVYNARDEATGFTSLRAEFRSAGRVCFSKHLSNWEGAAHPETSEMDVVDLPQKQWVALTLSIALAPEEFKAARESEEIWFIGTFPDGKLHQELIRRPPGFRESRE